MKKTVLMSLVVGITWMFTSWAMAASKPSLPAPSWSDPCATVDTDSVYFDWSDVEGAKKYCVEVEVLIDGDWETGLIARLSFGTSDRTDDGLMGDSDLDVLFTDFVYDLDGDPLTPPEPLYGYEARAKVKALNPPGKGAKSQNNPFSDWCEFTIETPEAPPLP